MRAAAVSESERLRLQANIVHQKSTFVAFLVFIACIDVTTCVLVGQVRALIMVAVGSRKPTPSVVIGRRATGRRGRGRGRVTLPSAVPLPACLLQQQQKSTCQSATVLVHRFGLFEGFLEF